MISKNHPLTLTLVVLCLAICSLTAQDNQHSHSSRIVNGREIQAYSDGKIAKVKIAEYIFKKLNANKQVVAFANNDSKALLDFFVQRDGVLVCEAHALDKTVRVIGKVGENEGQTPGFDHRGVLPVLAEKGYVVIGMHTRYDMMRFTDEQPNDGTSVYRLPGKFDEDRPFSYNPNAVYEEDCSDCDSVAISRDMLEKYQKQDYGGEQINFEFDDVFAPELPEGGAALPADSLELEWREP